jgi:hypothetical protein
MMADFTIAYRWSMSDEDPANLHQTVKDACPDCYKGPGPCFAISGINSGAWPLQFAKINALPPGSEREPEVMAFYKGLYWNKWYEQLTSDEVAKRVFDMAVNGGAGTAVKLLQKAINSLIENPMIELIVDGLWGPATLREANDPDIQDSLVSVFQNYRIAHYRDIVAANPSKSIYLNAWVARARK